MQYRALGRSGLSVSRLILGSTMFGELMDLSAARNVFDRALELGVSTIDTGDVYAGGKSEEIVGRLVATRRKSLILCTKVGFRVGDGPSEHAAALAGTLDHQARWALGIAPHDQGLSRLHILSAVEDSLRRLATDYIDLYQIHRWDSSVPIDETLRALDDLVRSGKVRYIGCSNARSWQLYQALWTSDRESLARFAAMQTPYSLLAKEAEQDILPAAEQSEVGIIAYTVLAGGVLSGMHKDGIVAGTVLAQRPAHQKRFLTDANRTKLTQLQALAARLGRSQTGLALAAVLAHNAVTAATVGVQHPEELNDLVEAVDQPLDAETYREIWNIFPN